MDGIKDVKNAFTVDVEEHFQVAALKGAFDPSQWSEQDSRVEDNTRKVLDILAEHDTRGTFFVLGWVAEQNPGLIRSIVSAGHELACHGYSHQLVYEQQASVFADETRRAKMTLEDISGEPIAGYRAASYSITAESIWALDILVDLGFMYDSSIVPARHDLYGIPSAPAQPYRIQMENGQELAEFPPSTIPLFGQRLPVGGGGYFRLFPYGFTRWALTKINNKRVPFSFYTHPWEVDPDQPRVDTNWKSRFRHYTNLDKTEPRLQMLLRDFRFSTMRSVISRQNLSLISVNDLVE